MCTINTIILSWIFLGILSGYTLALRFNIDGKPDLRDICVGIIFGYFSFIILILNVIFFVYEELNKNET